mmetsp:Transcript_1692/g.5145  ORF Transcript_1692/g.5145 Transcript_1692/m.5145 type:complete len:156 (-) Transcript_1692:776-1243(-)
MSYDEYGEGGQFLREGGATDPSDLLWQHQQMQTKRMLEKYGKMEEQEQINNFKKQQESVGEAPSSLFPSVIAKKAENARQQLDKSKKLLTSLVNVKKKSSNDDDGSKAENPSKKPKIEATDKPTDKKDEKPAEKKGQQLFHPPLPLMLVRTSLLW